MTVLRPGSPAARSGPAGSVRLMMSFAGKHRDVADPWYTGDFEKSYQDILEGCEGMLRGERL